MQKDYSVFPIPSFAKREAYNFDTTSENYEIYRELNEIAEEIESCRLKTCYVSSPNIQLNSLTTI